jgi:CRISPR/Cas system endoribonuclease Cas6 (RAMP superfamily)
LNIISPELFAAAISNVAEVTFDDTGATPQQMIALYSAITVNERPLRKLKMDIRLIGSIDPDIVVSALNRLEEVTVLSSCYGRFTVGYVHAIIKPLVDGESKLKRLMLKELDPVVVRQLDKELVRRARENIGEFYDSTDHFVDIFVEDLNSDDDENDDDDDEYE